jgi:hypothetical protein
MPIHQPFDDDGIQFRPGMDYRKNDAWQSIKQAQADKLTALARRWIEVQPYAGQDVDEYSAIEPFYAEVLATVGIKVKSTHPHANSITYRELTGLYEALRSGAIEAVDPQKSSLETIKSQLNVGEPGRAIIIRNAALQEARAQIDLEQAKNIGGRGI